MVTQIMKIPKKKKKVFKGVKLYDVCFTFSYIFISLVIWGCVGFSPQHAGFLWSLPMVAPLWLQRMVVPLQQHLSLQRTGSRAWAQ